MSLLKSPQRSRPSLAHLALQSWAFDAYSSLCQRFAWQEPPEKKMEELPFVHPFAGGIMLVCQCVSPQVQSAQGYHRMYCMRHKTERNAVCSTCNGFCADVFRNPWKRRPVKLPAYPALVARISSAHLVWLLKSEPLRSNLNLLSVQQIVTFEKDLTALRTRSTTYLSRRNQR